MLRFKDLRTKIGENVVFGIPAVGPFNPNGAVETPGHLTLASLTGETLSRLNAFLGSAFAKTYISPSNVMYQIKNKLQTVGLHFDYSVKPAKTGADITSRVPADADARGPITELGEGDHEFALSYLGGSYGRSPTDPGYEPTHSDNITNKIGTPLTLCVYISKEENGTYCVKPLMN